MKNCSDRFLGRAGQNEENQQTKWWSVRIDNLVEEFRIKISLYGVFFLFSANRQDSERVVWYIHYRHHTSIWDYVLIEPTGTLIRDYHDAFSNLFNISNLAGGLQTQVMELMTDCSSGICTKDFARLRRRQGAAPANCRPGYIFSGLWLLKCSLAFSNLFVVLMLTKFC
jgi:hypothetical protein